VDRVRNDSSGQNQNFELRLKKLANVHAQLLNHALKSYPNLERLVYSTCSANHEENEAVVDEALSVNGKFKLLNCTKIVEGWTNKGAPGYDCSEMCLNAVPSVDYTNGFFIAVFIRRDLEDKEVAEEEGTIEDEEVAEVEGTIEDEEVAEEEETIDDEEVAEVEETIEDEDVAEVEETIEDEVAEEEENIEDIKEKEDVDDIEIQEEKFENNEIIGKKVKKVKKSSIHNTEKELKNKFKIKKNKYIDDEVVKEETVIEHNEIVDKKANNIKKSSISNTHTNLLNKWIINNKNIESIPLVKSKNAKRRERRLKLEKANKSSGLQTSKKKKKVKSEET